MLLRSGRAVALGGHRPVHWAALSMSEPASSLASALCKVLHDQIVCAKCNLQTSGDPTLNGLMAGWSVGCLDRLNLGSAFGRDVLTGTSALYFTQPNPESANIDCSNGASQVTHAEHADGT